MPSHSCVQSGKGMDECERAERPDARSIWCDVSSVRVVHRTTRATTRVYATKQAQANHGCAQDKFLVLGGGSPSQLRRQATLVVHNIEDFDAPVRPGGRDLLAIGPDRDSIDRR